jgi:hypothetical protein
MYVVCHTPSPSGLSYERGLSVHEVVRESDVIGRNIIGIIPTSIRDGERATKYYKTVLERIALKLGQDTLTTFHDSNSPIFIK